MHTGIIYRLMLLRRAVVFKLLKLYPIKKNKFFCISMMGQSYGCNVKPLSDYIEKADKRNEVVWAFNTVVYKKYSTLRKGKCVKYGTLSYYKELLTSKYVLSNQRLDENYFPFKKKGQIYLQTWHGTALKRIEADITNWDDTYHQRVQPDSDKIDVFISGSRFMTNIYENSFWYSGKVYETGTPRNDIFFENHPEIKDKVRRVLNIKEDEKIILYAPTFRNVEDNFQFYDIDYKILIDSIEKKFGGKWKLLVRMHPNILNQENMARMEKMFPNAIDASSYPNVQELLYATNIQVTDYSSTMFDFMYTMRPCFLYVKDRGTYDRGFYFDLDELPFPKIESNQSLESIILNFDLQKYQDQVKSFMDKIGSVEDGHATENCYRLLVGYEK